MADVRLITREELNRAADIVSAADDEKALALYGLSFTELAALVQSQGWQNAEMDRDSFALGVSVGIVAVQLRSLGTDERPWFTCDICGKRHFNDKSGCQS